MKPPSETHVVIAGAGLVGALLACQLGKRGYRVTLCERRPDPRAAGFVGGRSINLALSCRGITALRRVGLDDTVLASSIRMPGRMAEVIHLLILVIVLFLQFRDWLLPAI